MENVDQRRVVPRYPLPKEKVKFFFEEMERIFGVRDISTKGLGITLLDHGEALLFPVGFTCDAELKLSGDPFRVKLTVKRISAWAVGFIFENLPDTAEKAIQKSIEPIRVGKSLKEVPPALASQAVSRGISAWYHGDNSTNLYLWFDKRGGIERALLSVGDRVWDWTGEHGARTGILEQMEGLDMKIKHDVTVNPDAVRLATGVLENADVLDFRLTKFLREQLKA
jgi:hypothetical protein